LLDDGPLAVGREHERVEINLKSVSDRVVVDASREPAGANQAVAIEADTPRNVKQFVRCLSRLPSTATANVYAELV
jgi:hypothetical protein